MSYAACECVCVCVSKRETGGRDRGRERGDRRERTVIVKAVETNLRCVAIFCVSETSVTLIQGFSAPNVHCTTDLRRAKEGRVSRGIDRQERERERRKGRDLIEVKEIKRQKDNKRQKRGE